MQTFPVTEVYGGTTVYSVTDIQASLDAIGTYVSPSEGLESVKIVIPLNINITPKTGLVQSSPHLVR